MKINPLNRMLGVIWALLSVSVFSVVIMKFSHPRIWALVIVSITTGMLLFSVNRYRRLTILKRFEGRESFSDEQIFQEFYSISKIPKASVIKEWHRVSTILEIPSGLLRPTDRFDAELSPVPECSYFDEGLRELIGLTGRRLAIPDDQVAVKIKTLDDYVRLVAEISDL